MPFAVELYFNDNDSCEIDKIRSEFKKNGISIDEGTEPHITLSIYQDLPLDDLINKLQRFAKEIKSFQIVFSSVGIFTNDKPVIFLAPVVGSQLLNIHDQFHNHFNEFSETVWDYYKPGKWVPHSTLCMNLSEEMFLNSSKIMKEVKFPIKVNVEKIGILEFPPNKQIIKLALK